MELFQALRLNALSRIAFVGAGGKTTAMFRAARQARSKTLTATTAHLATDEIRFADRHFVVSNPDQLAQTVDRLADGVNLFTGPEVKPGRLGGLDDSAIFRLKNIADQLNLPLLIEADGSRRLPAKVPGAHEPPIPEWVNAVVVTAGLSAVGQPLNDDTVFRAEIFSQISGLALGCPIQLETLVQVLTHPMGGLKNIPADADRIVLFNQWDTLHLHPEEMEGVRKILLDKFGSVLVASLRDEGNEVKFRLENVAGIILAAGGSERFGEPKQLLSWKGRPFIQHIVEAALQARLSPIVVVLGAVIEPIQNVLKDYSINIINNEKWSNGQASSIGAGVRSIAGQCGAAVFLLSDMPQVSVDVLQTYLRYHREYNYFILAPQVSGRPANPAMFDRRCFPALAELSGQAGGRQLFDRFPVDWLELDDPFLALDVDTPEDYQVLLEHEHDRNTE